jgi:hypothetical protein
MYLSNFIVITSLPRFDAKSILVVIVLVVLVVLAVKTNLITQHLPNLDPHLLGLEQIPCVFDSVA